MATVNGPLFSLDASGQLGQALVYSKWKGRNYVREFVTPANPRTLPQFIQRGLVDAISKWWAGIANETGAQESWNGAAAAQAISPFNAAVAAGIDSMRNDQPPTGYDGGGVGPTVGPDTITATSSNPGQLSVSLTPTAECVKTDLFVIAIGTNGGGATTAEHYDRIIAGQSNLQTAAAINFELSNLPPGDYYISGNVIGTDGDFDGWHTTGAAVTIA